MRSNADWTRSMNQSAPISVVVSGTPSGDVLVVESVQPVAKTVITETILDAKYEGDHGKLIIGPDTVRWQNLEHANRSRTWSYAEIKELERERDDNQVEIQGYRGDEYEFTISGPYLTDQTYNMIAERIVAARKR
jgi:hypothetical protein